MKNIFQIIIIFFLLTLTNYISGYDKQIVANNDLFTAVESGNLEAVKEAIGRAEDPNAEDEDMFTPLYYAAMHGLREIAEYLIDRGAFVDGWYDEYQFGFETPLHYAAKNGHLDVVELLLNKGARANVEHLGWTPLHVATLNSHLDIVDLLVARGSSIDATDDDGFTPLYLAVENNDLEIVSFLLKKAAQVNICPTVTGISPLHVAVDHGDTLITKLLLEHGAEVEAENAFGETALVIASSLKNKEIIALLEQYTKPTPKIEVEKGTVWFIHGDERYEVSILATSDEFPFGLTPTYALSHDSSYLVYVGESAQGYDIFLVSQDGDVRWITEQGTIDGRTSIAWSSDSKKFSFNMNERIWLYDVKRAQFKQLTNPQNGEDIYPSFKDDDKKVKFFRGGRFEYSFAGKEYEVTVDGSNCREVAGGERMEGERLD